MERSFSFGYTIKTCLSRSWLIYCMWHWCEPSTTSGVRVLTLHVCVGMRFICAPSRIISFLYRCILRSNLFIVSKIPLDFTPLVRFFEVTVTLNIRDFRCLSSPGKESWDFPLPGVRPKGSALGESFQVLFFDSQNYQVCLLLLFENIICLYIGHSQLTFSIKTSIICLILLPRMPWKKQDDQIQQIECECLRVLSFFAAECCAERQNAT